MWRFDFQQYQHDPRVSGLFQRVPMRHRWVILTALTVGVVVVVVPLVVLALTGLVVGFVTFVVLALVARCMDALGALFGSAKSPVDHQAGRRNVRVIDPGE